MTNNSDSLEHRVVNNGPSPDLSSFKPRLEALSVTLYKRKGQGRKVSTEAAYRAVESASANLSVAIGSGNSSAITKAASQLAQAAARLQGTPLSDVAKEAASIARDVQKAAGSAIPSFRHSDPIDLKTSIASALMDDDFMNSLIDDYR